MRPDRPCGSLPQGHSEEWLDTPLHKWAVRAAPRRVRRHGRHPSPESADITEAGPEREAAVQSLKAADTQRLLDDLAPLATTRHEAARRTAGEAPAPS
ncbi:hypothetical protein [Streptomyces sp. SID12501]|uniref:Uncharacterized protein n=1 Tax=Streptomyces sp. SID12501 TaxID=2706042 RepID=A0A6B3BT76_9ACTN|nr:hypothetical protein [Streptomyces sp. SID12501]NEC87561.1 hypothetical protein [Streptomyces sp. SID12501]